MGIKPRNANFRKVSCTFTERMRVVGDPLNCQIIRKIISKIEVQIIKVSYYSFSFWGNNPLPFPIFSFKIVLDDLFGITALEFPKSDLNIAIVSMLSFLTKNDACVPRYTKYWSLNAQNISKFEFSEPKSCDNDSSIVKIVGILAIL